MRMMWVAVVVVAIAIAAAAARPLIRRNCQVVDIAPEAMDPWWAGSAIAALLTSVAGWRVGVSPHLIAVVAPVPVLAWCTWTDVRTHRVPTLTVYALTAIAAIAGLLCDVVVGGDSVASWATRWLVGATAALILFAVACATSFRGVGSADVRLALPLGALAAYHGWAGLWSMFVLSYLLLLPLAVLNIIWRRSGRDVRGGLPFAPALTVGALAAALF